MTEIRKKKLGSDHPNTLICMNNLAFTLKEQGKDAEAISLMRDCVRLRKLKLRTNHPHFISSLNTLADWEAEQGEANAKTEGVAEERRD